MKTNELNHKLYLYKPNGADSDFLGELLVDNLKVDIRLHEISNISFTMPRTINGVANPRIDQVLDNYIVELHYGRVGQSYPDNYFKMRFVIYKTPLSFTDEKFLHNYEGASIESLLEFKSINNWPGVEVYDFFRTINYIRDANNFTEGSNTYANLESNSTTGQRYIRVEPNNVNPIFPLDIFLYEIRKNIVGGQPIETKNALIDFNFAGKDYTHPDFKVGFYYLDLNTDDSIKYIYIALPDNKASYENNTKNYLYNTFTTNETTFAYRLYDNPISKTFAVGPNTNEDTNPLSDMYITLSTNADVESGQSSFGGITYNFQKIYSKNGLTLRQILTGKTTPDDFPDISNIDGLLYDTGYKIGVIHPDIESLYRSNLQFNNITRYQALKQTAESFKSVIVFDTITKEVSFYPENEYGNHKGLILRYGSYLKSLNKDIDSTKIITAATSIGKDKTTISLVNPTGRSYWEDYAYFLDSYFINTDENNILDIISSNVLTLTTENKTLKTAATINTGIQHTALKVLYSGSTGGFLNRWFSSASFAKVVGEWQFARDLYNEIMLGNIKPSVDIPSLAALDRYYDLYRIRDEKIKIFVKYDTQLAEYEASMYKSKYLFDFYKKKWDELTPAQQQTNRTNRTDLWLKFNKYGIEYQSAVRTIEDFDSFILRPIREDLFGSETLKEGPDNSILRKFLEVQSALHRQPNATEVINSATYTTSIYLIDLDVLDTFKRYGVNSDNNIDNEIELLKATKVYLLENKYPKVTVNIDLVSLISAEEAQQDWDKTFIGDKVLIYLPELNVDLDAQIREVSIDFEANSTSLVIATVRDYNRTFGRFLSKIVRKLNNSNDNITKYYQDQFNEGSNNATLNKIQRKEGQRLDEKNKLFSGAQDSETGQSTTEFDGRGFQSAVIGEVDEATQTFKLVDAAEKGISNVDGALIAYYDRGTGGIRTEVEVSGDNGIVIRRIDNDTNETNKQMYIDAFGNAIFNGQLIVGGQPTPIDVFRSQILVGVAYSIEDLQNQIDGVINTWFGTEDPTFLNYPTEAWDPLEYLQYVGDLFYNTTNGQAFRFVYSGSTPETPDPEDFAWITIADNDVTLALSNAAAAQATADKKVTIFYAANQTDLDKITPPSGSGPELAEDGDMVVIGGIFTHSVSNIKYNTFDTYRWDDNLIPKRWVKTQNIYDKAEGSVGGWTVGSTTIKSNDESVTLNNAGWIGLKKTSYADQQSGAFLGMDGNTAKFNVGNNTRFLKWTGEELEVNGDIGGSIGQIAIGNNDIVISSTGITTASNKFSLSTAGILTAVDGNFSGTITANSGSIGSYNISSNSIYKKLISKATFETEDLDYNGWVLSGSFQRSGEKSYSGNFSVKRDMNSSTISRILYTFQKPFTQNARLKFKFQFAGFATTSFQIRKNNSTTLFTFLGSSYTANTWNSIDVLIPHSGVDITSIEFFTNTGTGPAPTLYIDDIELYDSGTLPNDYLNLSSAGLHLSGISIDRFGIAVNFNDNEIAPFTVNSSGVLTALSGKIGNLSILSAPSVGLDTAGLVQGTGRYAPQIETESYDAQLSLTQVKASFSDKVKVRGSTTVNEERYINLNVYQPLSSSVEHRAAAIPNIEICSDEVFINNIKALRKLTIYPHKIERVFGVLNYEYFLPSSSGTLSLRSLISPTFTVNSLSPNTYSSFFASPFETNFSVQYLRVRFISGTSTTDRTIAEFFIRNSPGQEMPVTPTPVSRTATRTSGSNQLTNIIGGTADLEIGALITGTGIPANTTITGFITQGVVMSANATSSGTASVTFERFTTISRDYTWGTGTGTFTNLFTIRQRSFNQNIQIRTSAGGFGTTYTVQIFALHF
jgi:hypothetical protein